MYTYKCNLFFLTWENVPQNACITKNSFTTTIDSVQTVHLKGEGNINHVLLKNVNPTTIYRSPAL